MLPHTHTHTHTYTHTHTHTLLFLTSSASDRALGVVCDVSCDVTNPYNPLPFVDDITTFAEPARTIRDAPRLDVVAIDHTPR